MPKNFSPKEWAERIRTGQRFQREFGNSEKWNSYRQYYRHNFGKNGIIPVNIVFSYLRSMVAQIYFKNPRVTITPRRPGAEREIHARILQELDNWFLYELCIKPEMKRMIADCFFCGLGTGFVGYDSYYGFDPEKLQNGASFSLTQFGKSGRRLEYNSNINPGMPWFLRARPEDVIWPWGCTSSKNAEWVALRTIRPLDDLKEDPKYKVPSSLTGSLTPLRTNPEGGVTYDDVTGAGYQDGVNNRMYVELFQIHDARTGQIMAVTLDEAASSSFIREPKPDELQIDGLPVETICFNPDPEYIYGVPDCKIIEPQQLELNEIRTQAMKHRRIDVVKALVKEGAMDDSEIQKMMSESVMSICKVKAESSIRDAILPMTPGASGILQDLAQAGEIVRGDVREMIGFSRIAQGEYQGKTHVSAAETKAVFQSLNIRLDERRDAIADMLGNVVRKFNQLIFTYWDSERVSKITGPDGAQWWVKYTGQQIKDEYDISVTPEDGANMDTGTKFQMSLQAAETWVKMNQGAIAQGQPVPEEIQRLLFNQFSSSGLDIDKLLTQGRVMSQGAQQSMAMQAGGSPQTAVAPGQVGVR